MKPSAQISDLFQISKEILCLVSDYDTFEVRTLDYADKVLREFGHRVTEDAFVLVSSASNARDICSEYLNKTGRTVIQTTWDDVVAASPDYPIELFRRYLFSRDLFDQKSPVSSDFQFFARVRAVEEIFDDLSRGQNRGIFGLRKTGKTSVLQRVMQKNDRARHFRAIAVDAQAPSIYENDAAGVALDLCRRFNSMWARDYNAPLIKNIPQSADFPKAGQLLEDMVRRLVAQGKPVLLVIDELERILPSIRRVTIWNTEYTRLWRLLRSISQSLDGRFVFLVASTNPFFVENPIFDGEDNPLYAFVRGTYLGLFDSSQLSEMITTLGKRMGVLFDVEAVTEIFRLFGGHPYLSRQFCSFLSAESPPRPLRVTAELVDREMKKFEPRMMTDLEAILQVFREFYIEEYEAFEALAKDPEFGQSYLRSQTQLLNHLVGYGLVTSGESGIDFSVNTLKTFFGTPALAKPTPPEISDQVIRRHRELQDLMNILEPGLRDAVSNAYRTEFGAEWRARALKHCQVSDDDVARRLRLNANSFMEELLFSDILACVLGNWRLFTKLFYSRDQFRRVSEGALVARRLSDHRKMSDCREDAVYIPARRDAEWLIDQMHFGKGSRVPEGRQAGRATPIETCRARLLIKQPALARPGQAH